MATDHLDVRLDPEHRRKLRELAAEQGARDLLHAAVMERLGIRRVISADADLDRLRWIERLDPAQLVDWRQTVVVPQPAP